MIFFNKDGLFICLILGAVIFSVMAHIGFSSDSLDDSKPVMKILSITSDVTPECYWLEHKKDYICVNSVYAEIMHKLNNSFLLQIVVSLFLVPTLLFKGFVAYLGFVFGFVLGKILPLEWCYLISDVLTLFTLVLVALYLLLVILRLFRK